MWTAKTSHEARPATAEGWIVAAIGLTAVLLVATLGEGGGAAHALVIWHGMLVVLLALLIGGRHGGGYRTARAPLGAIALFVGIVVLGALRVPYGYAALLLTIELGCCLAVLWIASRAGPALLALLAWPLWLGASVQGCVVLAQVALQDARPAGTFLNPSHMAAWVVAALLLAGPHVAGAGTTALRAAAIVLAVPAFGGVLASGSRAALLGGIAGAVFLAAVHWRGFDRRMRTAALVGLLAFLLLAGWRVRERFQDHDPFRYQRLAIWKASAMAVVDDPWWGTGPGQFAVAARNLRFPDGDGPLRYDRWFSASHSDLLRVPCELGLPAALALLAAFALAARELVRRRRRGELPDGADGAMAALVALAVPALVDNPSRWPSVYLLASAVVGALLTTPVRSPVRVARPMRLVTACLLPAVFLIADVGPTLAWMEMRRVPRPAQLDSFPSLDFALALNPLHPEPWSRRAEALAGDGREWDITRYALARESAEHAVRLQPADGRYRWSLARIEALACLTLFLDEDTRERAARQFRLALERSRYDARIALDAGTFLLEAGDPAGARRFADLALKIEPNAVAARLLAAEAQLAVTDADVEAVALLLREAEELAAAHADTASQGGFARALLTLDAARARRIAERLAIARRGVAAPR